MFGDRDLTPQEDEFLEYIIKGTERGWLKWERIESDIHVKRAEIDNQFYLEYTSGQRDGSTLALKFLQNQSAAVQTLIVFPHNNDRVQQAMMLINNNSKLRAIDEALKKLKNMEPF